MTQIARLTPLDKIQVGDKIYSKVIFNIKQRQTVNPTQQEFIILDSGEELRFYTDGSIYYKQGQAQPECLFNGQDWLKGEVLMSGTVQSLFLHQDPANEYSTGENGEELVHVNAHPHINYGWFDKCCDPNASQDFIARDEYQNCGMPNEQYLVMVKRMMTMLSELTIAYVRLANRVDALETQEA